MKKAESDELRPAYSREELGSGIRGKYYNSYQKGTNLVLISPDVAKVFQSEEAVNNALRSLIELASRSTNRTRPSGIRSKKEWDRQVQEDVRNGKLDKVAENAVSSYKARGKRALKDVTKKSS
jgi:hypothetical protein